MAGREIIELPHAFIEVEARADSLFVVESGRLTSLNDLDRYTRCIDAMIERTGIKRAVIDARGQLGESPEDVAEATWGWHLSETRGFEMAAIVLASEMAVARINMTALSMRANVRGFEGIQPAQRWLSRGPRFSTQAKLSPAIPTAQQRHSTLRPTTRGSTGYRSSETKIDRVGPVGGRKKRGGGGQVA